MPSYLVSSDSTLGLAPFASFGLFTYVSFGFFAESFPDSDARAQKAVSAVRNARIQEGPISSEWTVEDYLYSVKARLGPIKRLGGDVLTMMLSLFHALWPGVPQPKTVRGMAEKMAEAQDRLIEWRESAARDRKSVV